MLRLLPLFFILLSGTSGAASLPTVEETVTRQMSNSDIPAVPVAVIFAGKTVHLSVKLLVMLKTGRRCQLLQLAPNTLDLASRVQVNLIFQLLTQVAAGYHRKLQSGSE